MRTAGIAVAVGTVLLTACGPRRATTPGPEGAALVVLVADPDTKEVGRATVTGQGGTVELTSDRAATTVAGRGAPSPVQTLPEDRVSRLFRGTASSLPLPPQSFTLYFRFESNELTDESQVLVPGVLKAIAMRPAPDVAVVGHTDTTGDAKSNYALGLERANRVRVLLLGVGVEASLIEVSSHGESELVVKTLDETYEPRNRRVEISVR
jgi:outer membrane protein OmpA-like peptidoglycan-associated protein